MRKLRSALIGACVIASSIAIPASAEARPTCQGKRATKVGTPKSDEMRGTKGRDVIVGRGGADLIFGLGGDDIICGSGGGDTLSGGGGHDQVYGQRGGDLVYGDGGNDTIASGEGNFEGLIGGSGDDSIDGGSGDLDFTSYLDAPANMIVDLSAGSATGDGNDTLVAVEGIFGSSHDDSINGSAGPNYLTGEAGNDTIVGRGGGNPFFPDVYRGNAGDDDFTGSSEGIDAAIYSDASAAVVVDLTGGTASGGGGNDTLTDIDSVEATDFADTLTGDDNNNLIVGGAGDDRIEGAGGVDEAIFFGVTPVDVDLVAGTATGQGSDTLTGIEAVFGTDAADTIRGNGAANTLAGGLGKDQIFGDAGDDFLVGGQGTDTLDGGEGSDTCVEGETLISCESPSPSGAFTKTREADNFVRWMNDRT
jgi:Ca2+-binding RTX toxin-like protein